ncbi:DNA adenine methylase Dam [Mesorhizobium sp. ORS 3324]|nr:DNA adenine methylase Dam [Mesorhizobium sp. ORS 3324]
MTHVARISQRVSLEPFLKWAGGKRWFAERCVHLVPERFERFVEPFLGSGAMFFALQPARAILSDLNADLIGCYRTMRDAPEAIALRLADYQALHNKEHYYRVRGAKPHDPVERAVWFLYLNRTCWNGLYRVNRKNEFNVPIGTKSTVVLASDDFLATATALKPAEIAHCDFEETLDRASRDDFVFVDPPYTVKHNLNGFLKYNDKIFSWADQVRLRDAVARAAKRGAKVLITNANHVSIRELYEGLGRREVVSRASILAASSVHRVPTEELVIRTWLRSA